MTTPQRASYSKGKSYKTRAPLSPFLYNSSTVSPTQSSQPRHRKGIQTGKEKVKVLLFVDDMILHNKNSKDSTKKKTNMLEIINNFSKVARHKINIQKLTVLYTNNEISEREFFLNPTCKSIKNNNT